MNKQSICRLCSIKSDDYLEIFQENGRKLRIAEIISQHFWFQISEPDDFSESIEIVCKRCWIQLLDFHRFYTDIEKAQGRIELEGVKVEVKKETYTFENNFDTFGDDDDLDEIGKQNCWSDLNLLPTDTLKSDQPTKKETKRKKFPTETFDDPIEQTFVKTETKRNDKREAQNEYLRTFFNMHCELCVERCLSFHEICYHYKTVHNQPGYVRCCGRKFTSERTMKYHITYHVKPKALICDYCQKGFTIKNKLRNHMMLHLDPESRPFKCDKCVRTFGKQFQLTEHQKVKHTEEKEKKFICIQCDKRFIFPYQLQNHKNQNHGNENSFICDVCGKCFTKYSTYMEHKRYVHDKPMPPVQCTECGMWLTNRICLKTHMIIHIDGEKTCEHCFKVLKNRRSLRKHCKEVHTQQPLFKCHLCEKEFRREINLKEHMSSHTGAILYSCSFCPKTFNSSANMYTHRKKVHPIEYQMCKEESMGLRNAALLTTKKNL